METPAPLNRPSKQRALGAACVALLVLASATRSAVAEAPPAQVSPVTLAWNAVPICSDAEHVLDEITHILGEGPGPRKTVAARVELEQEEAQGWRVTLTVTAEGASRTRTFEAESCSAAKDAVALILAIDVDPQVAMRAPPPPLAGTNPPPLDVAAPNANGAPTPSVGPASPPPPPPPPFAMPAPPASSGESPATAGGADHPRSTSRFPLKGIAAASLALDSGSLPNLGVGANLALGVQVRGLRVELDGTFWGGQTASAAKGPGGADFQLWSGSLRAAYLFGFGRFSLGPLLDGGFERVGAQGINGTLKDTYTTEVWGVLGLGGLVLFRPIPHFALRLLAEGELPLSRPTFYVQNPKPLGEETVYRPSAVLGRAMLGVEVDFP
jgi:hypothetical protein